MPSELLEILLEVDVLDKLEVDVIRSMTAEHEKVNQLLHYILRSSEKQYQHFLETLIKANHKHVHDRLLGISMGLSFV